MHVCFVSQEYPPDTGWGGIGSYTYDMAHALVAAGHRVTVIARAVAEERTGGERIADDNGVQVHRVQPAPCWNGMRVLWRLNGVWPGFAWAAMRRLRSIHRRDPVDVVEAGECRADGFFVSWIPKPRPRIVTRLHLAWIFVDRNNAVRPDWKKRLCYWLEKQSILRADAVTAPSTAVVELTRTWLGPRLAARVVPNPIDTVGFSPHPNAREREVLFVGRLERGKGLASLCRIVPSVMRRCPDVRVRVLGSDGVDESGRSWRLRMLDGLDEEERRRIAFEHVSRRDLVQSYRQAGVCIVPSLWENCPYVVLEAMACGTPVVATRSGGLPELVQDGRTGLLVGPDDPEGFADAICELLNDPERSRRMGAEARRQAESVFSTATVARGMLDVYRELCRC
jgi:glycosyltransferase involved in cell wall biosynthesis